MLRTVVHLSLIECLLRPKPTTGSNCHPWLVFCEKHRVKIIGSKIHTILIIDCIKRSSYRRYIFSTVDLSWIFNIRWSEWVSIIWSLRILSLFISTICVFNLHSAAKYLCCVLFVTKLLHPIHLNGMILSTTSLYLLSEIATIFRIKCSFILVW